MTKEMYTNTRNILRINGELSDDYGSEIGVLQGNNYSPTIFITFINDLIKELSKIDEGVIINGNRTVNTLAYADNLIVLATSERGLQRLIDVTNEWCCQWRITINVDKTKIIHFRRGNVKETNVEFTLGDKKLDKVNRYRYLGLDVGFCLQNSLINEQLSAAGSHALGQLINKTKSNYDLDFNSYGNIFRACVLPVLNYCSGAWATGKGDLRKIDSVQHRAIRFYCGLPKKCPILSLMGDSGWTPLLVHRDLEVLRLYNQIAQMPEDCLSRQIFDYDRLHNGEGSWSKNLRSICTSIGKLDNYLEMRCISIKRASESLMKMYEVMWNMELSSKPKLELYNKLKPSFETAKYLCANLNKCERSLIGRLRNGVLEIELETARFHGVPRENRTCRVCDREVEDVVHLLLNCNAYAEQRKELFIRVPELKTNGKSEIELVGELCDRPHTLGRFLLGIWKKRNEILNINKKH